MMKRKLLVIEDEAGTAKQLKWGLSEWYDVFVAKHPDNARKFLKTGVFPVATLDLGLPPTPDSPEEGFRLLEEMSVLAPFAKIIVITGNSEQENAVKAVGLGAVDFCEKPVNLDLLKIILKRTFQISELEAANRKLQEECESAHAFCGMIGVASSMRELFKQIRQVSRTDYPVMIRGESGTGKEMAARAVHALSSRSEKPLVIINCGAIPENLLESELFGHEKGAFTGAVSQKIGKLEQAEKGTVFLDEIGDMPTMLQVKLLRFLQEGTIERVGSPQTISLNVRVIAATHVNLEKAVEEKRFREDLYYRLNVVSLKIPPLRERREDILLLANSFLQEEKKKFSRGELKLSSIAASALTAHNWPGNIRELQNFMKRAIAIATDKVIGVELLGLSDSCGVENKNRIPTIKEARETGEFHAVTTALSVSNNNISMASKMLNVSRPTLHDLIKKHKIKIG